MGAYFSSVRLASLWVLSLTPVLLAEPLPDTWFARHVTNAGKPTATLSGPVEEQWRASGREVVVFGERVLLTTEYRSEAAESLLRTATGGEKPKAFELIRLPHSPGLECRSLDDGRILWRVPGNKEAGWRFTQPLCFDDFVLVRVEGQVFDAPATQPAPARPGPRAQTKDSLWLIDARNGQVLRRYGPHMTSIEELARSGPRWPNSSSDPAWELLTSDRELWVKTILNPAGPTPPASGDPATWSWEQADAVAKAMGLLVRTALPMGIDLSPGLITPAGEVFYVSSEHFVCRDLASGRTLWETPCLPPGPSHPLAYALPVIVTYTADSAVTAYDVKTGRPMWTHQWPQVQDNYNRQIAVLEDGFLLLTNPQIRRPEAMRKIGAGPGKGGGVGVEFTTRSCLVKLDRQGKPVFRQELPLQLSYACMRAAKNAVLIRFEEGWGQSTVVCFGPVQTGVPRSQPARDEKKIQRLLVEYENADAVARTGICLDLVKLGDTSIAERVLADFDQADPKDRENYVRALGILGDARAIPKLLPLLEERSGHQMALVAIEAITDGEPLKDEAYRQWREGRLKTLRAEFARTGAAFNRAGMVMQLCELGDPEVLDLLLKAIDQAAPSAWDVYLPALGALRDYRAVPKLLELLKNAAPADRFPIEQALQAITGARFAASDAWAGWWQAHRHLYEPASETQRAR